VNLLNLKLLLGFLLFFFLCAPPTFAQQQYFFQEEFNEERPPQILNPDKWIVYPNRNPQPDYQGCLVDTVRETGGILLLKQCSTKNQFPYVVSKNNPFPQGNFTAETRLQFTTAGALSTGIHFADTAPENGAGFTSLFTISFEEDGFSGLAMRIEYKDQPVYTKQTNTAYHLFKVTSEDNIYKLYFDNQLVFTSPPTAEKVKVVFIGTPAILPSPGYPWAWPRIDYIRITDDGPSEVPFEPFLEDLPWDYLSKGLTFNDAAMSMTAYFDHEYPLLSLGVSLTEPLESQDTTIYFKGGNRNSKRFYSTHDGYDYGTQAKATLGTQILAPADGEASLMTSCTACGNAILIDHKNGYQTRYYHLQEDALIVSTPGEKVSVIKGQQIGKVGFSGNVIPTGESGAHLHFMVVQDKNNDGNFSDNIPDGVVDPFGWQSADPDPWENYTFKIGEEDKTGSKSNYLFTKKLDNLDANLSANEAIFNIGKTKLEFPQGATDQNLNLSIASAPNFTDTLLNSLGSTTKVEAKKSSGELVTTFLKNFSLTINFAQFDLIRYLPETLSIYSSPDGQTWTKENTTVDLNNKTAKTSLNHLTYFALMAERKDILAPTTTPILEGQKGTGNNFRSDVNVILNASDNPNGLGVEFTAYSINESNWQAYSTPLTFSNEGNYKITFYSQDKDENIEEIKTIEFSIDKTIPEAKIEVDKSDWDLRITPVATDSAQITKTPGINNKATYTLTDPAGNTLTLETYDLDTKYIDVFKLLSLKYNNDPKLPQPENIFDTNYLFLTPRNKPETKIVNQNFILKDKAVYVITADLLKNKTILNIIENRNYRKEEKPGVVLLKLQTNKGKLEYTPQ